MITEIKDTDIICVDVAPDASNYTFGKFVMGSILFKDDIFYDTKLNWNGIGNIVLPEGLYKILGEGTKDEIDFDVEPYVECVSANLKLWRNYNDIPNYFEFQLKTKEESFYSRLASNGIYFMNPMGEKHIYIDGCMAGDIDGEMWKSYEDKLVEKLIFIQKIK